MTTINYYKRNNGSEAILQHVGFHESGDYLCHWGLTECVNPFRYHKYEFENEFVLITKDEAAQAFSDRQRCGRRGEGFFGLETEALPDYWKKLPNGDRVCSFCGSLHPESVIQIIKEHGFQGIQRSDKSYKWYISRPNIHNALEGGIKYYRMHDTPEFIAAYNELLK